MQLDKQVVRCTHCEAEAWVNPDDLTYGQSVECPSCGKFFDVAIRDIVECILRWLADL